MVHPRKYIFYSNQFLYKITTELFVLYCIWILLSYYHACLCLFWVAQLITGVNTKITYSINQIYAATQKILKQRSYTSFLVILHVLDQWFPNFSAADLKNNSSKDLCSHHLIGWWILVSGYINEGLVTTVIMLISAIFKYTKLTLL